MEVVDNIREWYKPVQPTVKQSADHVRYFEFLPTAQLQPFIYCYWQLKTTEPIQEEFNYRVVADGCIDIFFDLNDPRENFVMGFCKRYTAFRLENSFNYIGIRFLPTMFPQIFKIDALTLSNRFEDLDVVVPSMSKFISTSFDRGQDAGEIVVLLDQYFLNLLSKVSFDFDSRLYEAIAKILLNYGVVNIEKDLAIGISSRQLQRLFGYYVGDTAKTFSKVVRFQNMLRAKPSTQSLKQNKLFFDAGYYDQAHFIKEFRNFYGVTPSHAFGR